MTAPPSGAHPVAPPSDHDANLLGALALAVSDRMLDAVAGTPGFAPTTAAALSALAQFLDAPAVDQLAQVVGLSQSGGVRLVDRLAADGLVTRQAGRDGRTAEVCLTDAGRQAADQLAGARLALLRDVLSCLAPDEQVIAERLIGKLLVGLMREPGATRWTCRLCELHACGRADGRCPLQRAAAQRYGAA